MRKNFRPMALMKVKASLSHTSSLNGEELPKLARLMHDTRSEFSKNIRSYNLAVNTSMNKHLSQTLREVHTKIDGLNRSQQATYSTMCKIVEIQRRAAKEAYKKFQQDPRQQRRSSKHTQIKRKGPHPHRLSPLSNPEPTVSSSEENHIKNETTLAAVAKRKSCENSESLSSNNHTSPPKCRLQKQTSVELSVEGGAILNTMTTVDSKHGAKHTTNTESITHPKYPTFNKKAFFTASLRPTLPPIIETGDGASLPVVEDEPGKESSINSQLRKISNATLTESGRRSSTIPSPIGSTDDTVVSARMATALRSQIAHLEKSHMNEFLRKQNLDTKLKPYQLPTISEDESTDDNGSEQHLETTPVKSVPKVNSSIAAERRKLAKLRTLHRKTVLNSEDIYIYVEQPDRTFKPEGNSYKRKRFLPPSNREEMERRQIIKKIQGQMEEQDSRIGSFFAKLDIPLEKKLPKQTIKPKSPESSTNSRHPQPLALAETKTPSTTRPSAEETSSVAYVREYIRPADRSQFTAKVTSWQQNY